MARDDSKRSNSELNEEALQIVRDKTAEIQKLTKDRSAINAKMNSARKAIKALGIDLDAWRASLRRKEMDPEDRNEFDRSQQECNRALGVPVQADLFGE